MVTIDIESEQIIGLSEVGKFCPGPRKPSRATVFRWVLDGLRIDGTNDRVKLASVKLNGIRCTSVEEVRRFLRTVNGLSPAAVLSAQQRHSQAKAANQQLISQGR